MLCATHTKEGEQTPRDTLVEARERESSGGTGSPLRSHLSTANQPTENMDRIYSGVPLVHGQTASPLPVHTPGWCVQKYNLRQEQQEERVSPACTSRREALVCKPQKNEHVCRELGSSSLLSAPLRFHL